MTPLRRRPSTTEADEGPAPTAAPLDDGLPGALRPTMAARRAARLASEARIVVDPASTLVCVYDQHEEIEDKRTKSLVGSVRVRRYADKRALQTDVAERYDDEPIRWYNVPAAAPPQEPRVVAIQRRWKGNRPATGEATPPPVFAGTVPRWRGNRPSGDFL